MDPLHKAGVPGNTITVWPNRVEIAKGFLLTKKTTTIPLKSISSVDVNRLTGALTITTHDGKRHSLSIFGADKVREAILNAL